MRLKSLYLQNIGPHTEIKIDFRDGLIMLCGPQGSGKTTLMNAFYASVTNDFTRMTKGTKEGTIRQQAAPSTVSRIVAEANHGGVDFTITRVLQPKVQSRIQTSTGIDEDKSAAVERELAKLLGSSRKVLDTHVFVDQWHLLALLNQRPAERAETLSHLCGTAFIEDCYDLLGKQITADQQLRQYAAAIDLDAIRKEIGDFNAKLTNEAKLIAALRLEVLDVTTTKALEQSIRDFDAVLEVKNALPTKRERLTTLTAQAVTAGKNYDTLVAHRDKQQQLLDEFKETSRADADKVANFNTAQAAFEALATQRTDLQQVEAKLSENPPADLEFPDTVEGLDLLLTALDEELSPLQTRLTQLRTQSDPASLNCETCGQLLPDAKKRQAAAKAELPGVEQRIAELSVHKDKLSDRRKRRITHNSAMAVYKSTRTEREKQRTQLVQAIEKAGDKPAPTGSHAELVQASRASVKALNDQRKVVDDLKPKVPEASQQVESLKATTRSLQTEIAGDEAKVTKADLLTSDEYTSSKELLENSHTKSLELAGAVARQDQLQEMIEDKKSAIAQAEELRQRGEQVETMLGVWERARVILQRDNLPKKVHQLALRKLEGGINRELRQFDSPFTVSTEDDLTYMAHFRNDTTHGAQWLSGGQKVVLMISFRWVLNSVFANQIGMLSLDEPTAGLDDEHMKLLENALVSLGAAAKSQGTQIFIITHELQLKHVFDQVVELPRLIL